MEVRTVRPAWLWWERLSGPVGSWLRNRWNWRKKRRMRADIDGWKILAIPVDELDIDVDPPVRRMAKLAERLGYSIVLHLGYGMGEAVVVAAVRAPDRIGPLVELASRFSDEQLRGADSSPQGIAAVRARNALLREVREIVSIIPKAGSRNDDST